MFRNRVLPHYVSIGQGIGQITYYNKQPGEESFLCSFISSREGDDKLSPVNNRGIWRGWFLPPEERSSTHPVVPRGTGQKPSAIDLLPFHWNISKVIYCWVFKILQWDVWINLGIIQQTKCQEHLINENNADDERDDINLWVFEMFSIHLSIWRGYIIPQRG